LGFLSELRWIMLGLGAALIAGIWWRGTRRGGQASGMAELRESDLTAPPVTHSAPARELSIRPMERLSVETTDLATTVVEFDLPMIADKDEIVEFEDVSLELDSLRTIVPAEFERFEEQATPPASPPAPVPAPVPALAPLKDTSEVSGRYASVVEPKVPPRTDTSGRFARPDPAPPPVTPLQKIVTVRLSSGSSRWLGSTLRAGLEAEDLTHGRYGIYHRSHSDGRSIFCVASLLEPGVFDPARMAQQEFHGVSIFAILPGPVEPTAAFDAVLGTAQNLRDRLNGVLQDDKGLPLGLERVAEIREEVERFGQLLQGGAAQ
jgi:cell division protein ZipA